MSFAQVQYICEDLHRWPGGWRRGLGRLLGPRVMLPPSPPHPCTSAWVFGFPGLSSWGEENTYASSSAKLAALIFLTQNNGPLLSQQKIFDCKPPVTPLRGRTKPVNPLIFYTCRVARYHSFREARPFRRSRPYRLSPGSRLRASSSPLNHPSYPCDERRTPEMPSEAPGTRLEVLSAVPEECLGSQAKSERAQLPPILRQHASQ